MGDPVSQYGDGLVEDGRNALSDLRAAWDFAVAATRVDVVHLRKVRADAAVARLLDDLGVDVSDSQQAPYVAFDGITDYAAFEQRYPKAARKNRKRQLRRLQDGGETIFERLPAGDQARDAASVAMSLKRTWLKDRGLVSAALTDPRTESFFRDCASGRGPATGVEIGVVRSNGDVAAIEIAVRCRDRVAVHVIAYNLKFEKTGAGALLMEDSIRRACEGGLAALDLMAPGAAYKFDWADRAIEVRDHAIGLSTAGKLYTSLYLKRVRPAAKHAVEQLPTALRRHLSTVFAALPFAPV
jgi:CelD/BcsL family acetyltransferase involved in cellulose biosynthesis